uniref:Putative secreted protein n=1 Tax=Ixodes ricinus TaxID=34613 RepID=A0A6B0U2U6_IXORI
MAGQSFLLFVWYTRGRCLDPGGVEHDAHPSPHGQGRHVAPELGPHHPTVAVGASHLAPDGPKLRVVVFVAGNPRLAAGRENETTVVSIQKDIL